MQMFSHLSYNVKKCFSYLREPSKLKTAPKRKLNLKIRRNQSQKYILQIFPQIVE